jgi:Ubiquitin-conjugating enzyme
METRNHDQAECVRHGFCVLIQSACPERLLSWPAHAVLVGIQDLLDTPNPQDAAQEPAWRLFQKGPAEYNARVRTEVKKYIQTAAAANDVEVL